MDPEPTAVSSHLQGTVVSIEVAVGDVVRAGTVLALVESMKLHHEVRAESAGIVTAVHRSVGTAVVSGDVMFLLSPPPVDAGDAGSAASDAAAVTAPRRDLADVAERHQLGRDPTPSPGAAPGAGERRGRTSATWSTPGRSSSTDRW